MVDYKILLEVRSAISRFYPAVRERQGNSGPSAAAKIAGKGGAQHVVDLRHRRRDPECRKRGDAMLGDAAGDDAAVMVEVGVDVERHAVIGHPAPHAHADRGDLVLAAVRPYHPDADPAGAAFAADAEPGEGTDHPFLETVDMAAHVAVAPDEIEHDIGDALTGAVEGVPAAAPGAVHGQPPRVEKLLVAGAGPGGVERRVFEQPDELGCGALADGRDASFHVCDGRLVIDRRGADSPL